MARDNIRNFCIIAHIDHGKSTLSDRILELTQSVDERTMENQILDNMDIERERGITIKARAVTMQYTAKDGKSYDFNLIDTPGHVDFAYEVSRSLAACEGAILVVDATQGVEAQTLANTYMALEHDLELVPILNKIDLPSAHPEEVAQEVEDVIGLPCLDAPRVSAKTGLNIDQVLERVVTDIPAPTGDPDAPLKALIFDSIYDSYKGVIVYIRVFEGTVKPGDTIRLMATGAQFTLVEVGHMGATSLTPCDQLTAGEVGYLTASIKTVQDTRVGDTVTLASRPTAEALPGYRQVKPMVFCGIYPADGARYPDLKDALEKLQLNDASLTFEMETSAALGFGFRCGFLGLLHMEIITERLEREFDLDLITTTPSVRYRLTMTDGTVEMIDNPSSYPDPSNIVKQEEPFVDVHLYTPNDYVGSLMDLCQQKRGVLIDMKYLDDVRVDLHYALPLGEIVYDFFDAIKSRSRGYASYDYEFKEYRESDLVKLDFLLNGEVVDALSMIVFRDNAYAKGRRICEKLRDNIPRTLFEIPVQAAIGGKIIARETVKAMRKDVLAKCYGGDITRKEEAAGKAEGRQKEDASAGLGLPAQRGLYCRAETGQRRQLKNILCPLPRQGAFCCPQAAALPNIRLDFWAMRCIINLNVFVRAVPSATDRRDMERNLKHEFCCCCPWGTPALCVQPQSALRRDAGWCAHCAGLLCGVLLAGHCGQKSRSYPPGGLFRQPAEQRLGRGVCGLCADRHRGHLPGSSGHHPDRQRSVSADELRPGPAFCTGHALYPPAAHRL